MSYRQITFAERYTVALLRQQGLSAAAIARVLGRHRSTIGREVRRNQGRGDGAYRPQLADWSPEQIAGRLRRQGRLHISHETIYRWIWADKAVDGSCIATSAVRGNNGANGVARMTVVAGSRGSGRSRVARQERTIAPDWVIGKATPFWGPCAC